MTYQEATTVVTAPLAAVERRLGDVESWTGFLVGVDQIRKLSHERYLFQLAGLDGAREVRVAVRAHLHTHRVVWRALGTMMFGGAIHLESVVGGWTKVTLSLTTQPDGFLANLTDMVASSNAQAAIDVQRLQDHLTHPMPITDLAAVDDGRATRR